MIDLTPILTELLKLLPSELAWLAIASPVLGMILQWLKAKEKLQGWALLGVAFVVAVAIVASLGIALDWQVAQWRTAPLGIFVLVAGSNLTATTAEHVQSRRKS